VPSVGKQRSHAALQSETLYIEDSMIASHSGKRQAIPELKRPAPDGSNVASIMSQRVPLKEKCTYQSINLMHLCHNEDVGELQLPICITLLGTGVQ
jgi:hypothetical protein